MVAGLGVPIFRVFTVSLNYSCYSFLSGALSAYNIPRIALYVWNTDMDLRLILSDTES